MEAHQGLKYVPFVELRKASFRCHDLAFESRSCVRANQFPLPENMLCAKTDCTVLDLWSEGAKVFLKQRMSTTTSYLGSLPLDSLLRHFSRRLEHLYPTPAEFHSESTYLEYFPDPRAFSTTRSWFKFAYQQHGNEFLRSMFSVLCCKRDAKLVDFVIS